MSVCLHSCLCACAHMCVLVQSRRSFIIHSPNLKPFSSLLHFPFLSLDPVSVVVVVADVDIIVVVVVISVLVIVPAVVVVVVVVGDSLCNHFLIIPSEIMGIEILLECNLSLPTL